MSNPFGGKNAHGLYVPLSEDEMEVLERLADAREFKIVVREWGYITNFERGRPPSQGWNGTPILVFGDKRISFYFRMNFNTPIVPQPNWFFDVEVWAAGFMLFGQRMPTEVNGRPVLLGAGVFLDLALDVAIDKIDPAIVKTIKPKMVGLTTRHGNMKLTTPLQKLLFDLQQGEQQERQRSSEDARLVTIKAKQ